MVDYISDQPLEPWGFLYPHCHVCMLAAPKLSGCCVQEKSSAISKLNQIYCVCVCGHVLQYTQSNECLARSYFIVTQCTTVGSAAGPALQKTALPLHRHLNWIFNIFKDLSTSVSVHFV